MKKLDLLLLLLLLLAGSANLHVVKASTAGCLSQSSIEGRHLSSSSHNGDAFVGAGGMLYQLSNELQQLQNVSLPGNILGLTTTADGDWLVTCFTSRTCAVYNTSDMNTIGATFQNELILPDGFSTIALFMAKLSGCGGWEQQQV